MDSGDPPEDAQRDAGREGRIAHREYDVAVIAIRANGKGSSLGSGKKDLELAIGGEVHEVEEGIDASAGLEAELLSGGANEIHVDSDARFIGVGELALPPEGSVLVDSDVAQVRRIRQHDALVCIRKAHSPASRSIVDRGRSRLMVRRSTSMLISGRDNVKLISRWAGPKAPLELEDELERLLLDEELDELEEEMLELELEEELRDDLLEEDEEELLRELEDELLLEGY